MAVPTRTEALALFVSVSPSRRLFQHATVVAEVASFLAYRGSQVGLSIDRRLVVTAALLHDIDKALPRDHPLRARGHGEAGAAWLSEAGHPELARAVAAHPVLRLGDPTATAWVLDGPIEERIVGYADKRATQRVVSLEQRFARWRRRHPDYSERLDVAFEAASTLEATLCEAIAIKPRQVERLRWVDDAMARALERGDITGPPPGARPPSPIADAATVAEGSGR